MTTYLRSCALNLALDDLRAGWLKPKRIEQRARFSLGQYLRGNPNYWNHSLTVDGVWIADYRSGSKDRMTEAQVIEVLAGGSASDAPHLGYDYGSNAWVQLRTNVETWAVKAFDHRNFEKFGLTVGSTVTTADTNYFGGQKLIGEVSEVDPEDDEFNIWVKFDGFPYLVFRRDELVVKSQPVKVPMSLALPQENRN